MNTCLIHADELTVEFPVYNASHRSLHKALLRGATGGVIAAEDGHPVTVRALDRVSLQLWPGDRVGLIGHNGAGKTTLLRTLAGVYAPSHGQLQVEGRIMSMLDITMGMESEATGYENMVFRGLLLGMSRAHIRAHLAQMAAFSELGDYLDLPLRTYSSGMLLRLAFAVSTCLPADILLMDEWLSVGDADFNVKASAKLQEMISRTAILVLASHSRPLIRQHCTRVFQAEHGRLTEIPLSTLE